MKYGIKSILRAPVKTGLFLLLIAAVSVFLSLGVGILAAARGMLRDLDGAFLIAGEIVFQGGYYPEAETYDPALARVYEGLDWAAIKSLPEVLYSEESIYHRTSIDGVELAGQERPYGDYVILRAKITTVPVPRQEGESRWGAASIGGYAGHVGEQFYQAEITSVIYAGGQAFRGWVYLFLPEDSGLRLEQNHTYLISGYYFDITGVQIKGLIAASPDDVARASGYASDAEFPYILDITDRQDPDSAFFQGESGVYYQTVIEMMTALNRSLGLVASAQVEAVEAFQRGEATLIQGTYFTPKDYQTGGACLIPAALARAANVEVGDMIPLNIHHATGQTGLYTSHWPPNGFASTGEYRVAGIYQSAGTVSPIYIPFAGQDFLRHSDNDYTLGRVVVKNGAAAALLEAVRPLLPPQVSLNLYDQGYEAAARAPRAVAEMARVIVWVSLTCALVVLFFFGYLFVYRNAASARILLQLGAGGWRAWLYLLSGGGAIAAVAAAGGAATGYVVSRRLSALMYRYAQEADIVDRRFSSGGFGELREGVSASLGTSAWIFAATAVGILLVTLLLCSLFARQGIRRDDPRLRYVRQLRRARRHARTSRTPKSAAGWANRLPTPPLRYAVRAMARGGARFWVVTGSFAILLAFICVLQGQGANYQRQLASVYDDVPVTLHYTDVTGRKIDKLAVPNQVVSELAASEFVADIWYSTSLYYNFSGVIPRDYVLTLPEVDDPAVLWGYEVDFAAPGLTYVEIPANSTFALETFYGQLKQRFDTLMVTGNPARAPEFFYAGTPEITWAEGYDMERYRTERGLIVSTEFLARYGVAVGDRIALQMFGWLTYGDGQSIYFDTRGFDLIIVGAFHGYNATVYMPHFDALYWTGDAFEFKPWYGNNNYGSAGALLQDTARLSEFKDWVAERYDPLNRYGLHRRWVLVDDVALYHTIETLNRYILYTNILLPVLFVVAVGIGFLIANLLLRSRRREIALLRSLGQRRGSIFLALFWEQIWSCIPGVLLGVGAAAAILGRAEGPAWQAVWIFGGCYLAGAAAAILQAGRVSAMEHLAEKEG